MDSQQKFYFSTYRKVPSLIPTAVEGTIVLKIIGSDISFRGFFFKKKYSIYDIKEFIYGETKIGSLFIALKVDQDGKDVLHVFSSGIDIFNTQNKKLDNLLKIFKDKTKIRRVEDKILTGRSLRQYLNN